MAQVAIFFKEIFDHAKDFRPRERFILAQTSQRLTLYLLHSATDNIHIVLENDNTVLSAILKGCKC